MQIRHAFIMCTLCLTAFGRDLFSQVSMQGVVWDNGASFMGGGVEPVVNALLELTDLSDPARRFSGYTDSEGRYLIRITESGADIRPGIPEEFRLLQNHPNPFNPSTVISFELPHPAKIRIDVHNVLGRKVKTLFEGYQSESSGRVVWDATDDSGLNVPAGVYIYSLTAEGVRRNRKMLLLDGGNGRSAIPGSMSGPPLDAFQKVGHLPIEWVIFEHKIWI